MKGELQADQMEVRVVELLKKHHLRLTTAESCTGGAISAAIVNVPGASEVLMQGLVTYANEAKERYLGVNRETLINYGAVSTQTAEEMAAGACSSTGTEVSVATTGIAGPGGGTPEKPVGLVYIGCCVLGKTVVKEFHFQGDRQEIRSLAVQEAFRLLMETVTSVFCE
ncbi:MAG: CinA family protein [Fusicatenibacter sp.]|nr:CinA family protein [Lachnospiraceae bacterium]MDY2938892.1 CinA family protein [Fusicatenibacter sp.]